MHRISVKTKPFIWFSRGRRTGGGWVLDWISGGAKSSKGYHIWGDVPRMLNELVYRLTDNGAIILDPFCGGGTVPAVCKMLGRRYLAFEIDPDTAELARRRVRETQPPLPGLVYEQSELMNYAE